MNEERESPFKNTEEENKKSNFFMEKSYPCDIETIRHLHHEAESQKRFEITGIWESLKFHTSLATFILTAIMTGLYFSAAHEGHWYEVLCFHFALGAFGILGMFMISRGQAGAQKAYERFLEETFILKKLTEKMGTHEAFKFGIFSEEKYLWDEKYLEMDSPTKNCKDYVAKNLQKENYLAQVNWTYCLLYWGSGIAVGLVVIQALIILLHK